MICKNFLPFWALSFPLVDNVLWCTKVLNFDEIQLIYFFFSCLCFWCHILKSVVGLPWWHSGWESACQCRDTGSSPGLGGSHMLQSNWPHVPQLLSLCSGAREPQLQSPHAATTEALMPRARALQQEKPLQWEAHAPQRRVAPARHN